MYRLARPVTAVLGALALVLGLTTPASASTSHVTFGTPDLSTQGRVTGTITTDVDQLHLQIYQFGRTYDLGDFPADPNTHEVSYDFETWGLENGFGLVASGTYQGTAFSSSLAIDPDPTPANVTWPDPTLINPDVYDYQPAVSDTGGGKLIYYWKGTPDVAVADGVPVSFAAGDAAQVLALYRCSTYSDLFCSVAATSPKLTVMRSLSIASYQAPSYFSPDGDGNDEGPSVYLQRPFGVDVSFEWWVTDVNNNPVAPTDGSHFTGQTSAGHTPPLTIGTQPAGTYRFHIHPYLDTPELGRLDASTYTFDAKADNTPAKVVGVTRGPDTFYPYVDTFRDVFNATVTFRSRKVLDRANGSTVKVLDSTGAEVGGAGLRVYRRSTQPHKWYAQARWNGRDSSGAMFPEGDYVLRVSALDDVGHTTVQDLPVTLSHDVATKHSWRHSYRAAKVLAKSWVGRCSTLRKPSTHRWRGSLGYLSNTKCGSSKWRRTRVVGLNVVQLPQQADAFRSVKVRVTGEGARHTRRGRAVAFWVANDGSKQTSKVLKRKFGTRPLPSISAAQAVFPDKSIGWVVETGYGLRYDVKKYTVVCTYWTLAPPA